MKRKNLTKNYIGYLIPTIGSMILFSTYTMVDGIFVGRGVGKEALSSVNLSMPFVSMIFAIAMLISIGCSNLISYELGRDDKKKANEFFSIGIFLGSSIGLFLTIISLFNIRKIAVFLGAEGELVNYVVDYLGIIVMFSAFYILTYMFEIMAKADGSPNITIILMVASSVTNIVLDYVFIYIFKWGIKGAAIATGISQVLPTFFYFMHFFSKHSILKFRKFSLSFKKLISILTYGVPASLTELSTGATITFFNLAIAKYYKVDGLAVFSVIVYLLSLVVNTMIAVNQASQPLVSYNLGDEKYKNVKALKRMQLSTIAIMSLFFFVLVQFAPGFLIKIFLRNVDIEFLTFAKKILRIFSISFLVIGFNIGIGGYLTSIKKPKYEFIISTLRGYILVFLTCKFLPMIFGEKSIWTALIVSELLTLVVSVYLLYKSKRNYEKIVEMMSV